jgi:hypothetical protein
MRYSSSAKSVVKIVLTDPLIDETIDYLRLFTLSDK